LTHVELLLLKAVFSTSVFQTTAEDATDNSLTRMELKFAKLLRLKEPRSQKEPRNQKHLQLEADVQLQELSDPLLFLVIKVFSAESLTQEDLSLMFLTVVFALKLLKKETNADQFA
jgi:hypothetical protein